MGQPELVEKLAQNNLRQLNQRVVSRFHLLPLKIREVPDYINYRLNNKYDKGINQEVGLNIGYNSSIAFRVPSTMSWLPFCE